MTINSSIVLRGLVTREVQAARTKASEVQPVLSTPELEVLCGMSLPWLCLRQEVYLH